MLIRLFENFSDNSKLIEDIEDCFLEFMDSKDLNINTEEGIIISLTIEQETNTSSFEEYLNTEKNKVDKLNRIKIGLERLKGLNPNITESLYSIDLNDNYLSIIFNIVDKKDIIVGDYYKILSEKSFINKSVAPKKEVIINGRKLREILSLSYSCGINTTSNGSRESMVIYFESMEELEQHESNVISIMSNLKIESYPLITPYQWLYGVISTYQVSKKDFRNRRRTRDDIYSNKIQFGLNGIYRYQLL